MIITSLAGGLGNQLFQYSVGFNLSKKLKQKLILDISFFEKKHPEDNRQYEFILDKIIDLKDILIIKNIYLSRLLRLIFKFTCIVSFNIFNFKILNDIKIHFESRYPVFEYYNIPLASNYFINGYWQNLLYFENSLNEILNKFYCCKKISRKVIIGVHVRKGDIKNTDIDILDGSFYKKSIYKIIDIKKYDLNKIIIKYFTEDPEWVKNNIFIAEVECEFISGSYLDPSSDFMEMCSCNDLVIPNSTFSWWAAIFISYKSNDSIITYPAIWFPNVNSEVINLFPNNWIKIY